MRRHMRFVRSFTRALRSHHVELTAVAGLVAVLIFASAWLMWVLERGAGTFHDFGDALYWATITVTTVGYGDVVPATAAGRLVTSVVSLLGAGFLVMTAGILAMSFMEHLRPRPDHCPHCGQVLPERDPKRRWG